MKKVLVLGCPGSGKSIFSTELGKITGLPVIHLDAHYWKAGWLATPTDEWRKVVSNLMSKHERFIMDGNYSGTLDLRIKEADTIYYFNLPRPLCLYRVVKRRIKHHGRTRADMADGCEEKVDLEFLTYIWNFKKKKQHQMEAFLKEAHHNKQVIIFKKTHEADSYLKKLAAGYS